MARAIAREVGDSLQRAASNVDLDEIAGAVGVDPEQARQWAETAGGWLRQRAEKLGDDVAARAASERRPSATDRDFMPGAAPHPLDLPTDEQGAALAALDSGRWTVEPGSHTLAARADGPTPNDALGLVRELRARDWIAADGELTLAGRHALSRWLDAAAPL